MNAPAIGYREKLRVAEALLIAARDIIAEYQIANSTMDCDHDAGHCFCEEKKFMAAVEDFLIDTTHGGTPRESQTS